MTDRAQSWGGSLAQRAWRYLQESLERYDTADNDFQYRKVVLSKILDEDRSSRLPNWLMQFFEVSNIYILICFSADRPCRRNCLSISSGHACDITSSPTPSAIAHAL